MYWPTCILYFICAMLFKYLLHYRFAIIWALVVLALCGMNGAYIPHFELSNLFRIDKLAHLFLFGFLSYLIAVASSKIFPHKSRFELIFPAFLIGTAYGILIEILQATVFPNRTFDYLDMLANTIGCGLAWLILNGYLKRKMKNAKGV